jgi:hypothetical protein
MLTLSGLGTNPLMENKAYRACISQVDADPDVCAAIVAPASGAAATAEATPDVLSAIMSWLPFQSAPATTEAAAAAPGAAHPGTRPSTTAMFMGIPTKTLMVAGVIGLGALLLYKRRA